MELSSTFDSGTLTPSGCGCCWHSDDLVLTVESPFFGYTEEPECNNLGFGNKTDFLLHLDELREAYPEANEQIVEFVEAARLVGLL